MSDMTLDYTESSRNPTWAMLVGGERSYHCASPASLYFSATVFL